MEKFLRFGEIPKDELSYNFITNKKEIGVSVFKMCKDRMPIIETLNNAQDIAGRVDLPCYELTGDVVGVGFGGEPLLKNIQILKKRRISRDKFKNLILKFMFLHFRRCEKREDYSDVWNNISVHYHAFKINLLTGEKVDEFSEVDWDLKYVVKTPQAPTYSFAEWDFSEPILNFDTRLGVQSYEDVSKRSKGFCWQK